MARRKKEEGAAPLKWEDVPEIPKEEQPYPLPEGWKWVYLKDIALKIVDGSHNPPKDSKHGVPLLSATNINNRRVEIENATRWITPEEWENENKRTQIEIGDILLTIVGTLGRVAIVENPHFALQRSVAVINTTQNPKYLSYFLETPYIQGLIHNRAKGTAQKGFYLKQLELLPCAFPPLEIQKRIAERVDSLFSMLDEAAEKVQTVIDSHDARKQVILHQAFSGELTRNIEIKDEGPLKDIPEIPKDEQPYSLPKGWKWVRFGDVNDYKSKIINPINEKNKTFELYSVPSSANNYPEIVQGKDIGSPKQAVEVNDVLVCKINPRINRVWMVTGYTNNPLIASSEWIVFRNKNIDSNYIRLYFSSPLFREYMLSNVSGVGGSLMRAQPKFVKTYPLPLPPLKTQRRIADAVGSLFSQLDEAAEKVQAVIDSHEARKQAILHQAFSGS